MDIEQLAVEVSREDAGVAVHIKNAAGEPEFFGDKRPVTCTVAGSYSKAYRTAFAAQRSRNLRRGRASISDEEVTRQSIEVIASCVISWAGFTSAGNELPCDKTTVIAVLETAPWIMAQVEGAIFDHSKFYDPSNFVLSVGRLNSDGVLVAE